MRVAIASALAALAAATTGAYWHWSPHLVMRSARQAAASGDRDQLAQYVDLASVRAGLAAGIRAGVVDSQAPRSVIAAVYGAALDRAVDRAVEAAVNPQALAALVAAGQPADTVSTAGPARWVVDRPTLDLVVASPDFQAELPPQSRVRFVFERRGLFGWKLTEIRMPGMA